MTSPDILHQTVDRIHAAEMALRAAQAARLAEVWALMCQADCDRSTIHTQSVAAEIATLLQVSGRAAAHLMADTATIMDRPAVFAALADAASTCPGPEPSPPLLALTSVQQMLEPAAIDYGTGHTNHQLRVWLLAHLPDAATDKERAEAADGRRVDVIACPAGMSLLSAYLPTETAVAVFDTLDRIARTHAGDARSTDQRRADAFTDLLHHTTTVQTSVAIVLPATGHGATINTTPSPGRWPCSWPPPPRRSGRPGSPTPPAGSSTPPPGATASPTRWPAPSAPATSPAASPAAPYPPAAATSTTPSPSPPARPTSTICMPCAAGTTGSNTRPDGPSPTPATTPWNGPAPPATPTAPHPPPGSPKPPDPKAIASMTPCRTQSFATRLPPAGDVCNQSSSAETNA